MSHCRNTLGSILAAVICGWAALAPAGLCAELSEVDRTFFEGKVRPILKEHCYKCHSAEAEKVKGGLMLDTREGTLKGGDSGPMIVPGDPEKSRLIVAVRHTDPDLQMPPKEKLAAEQVAVLEEWVRRGAPDPRVGGVPASAPETPLWSAQPILRPEVPKTGANLDPIDAFLVAKLAENHLAPNPPAERRSLIRRATFDLTGLPPTPEEVAAFLADESPRAFAKVVDRLLAAPQFGERWGRHWLDLARYADSNGLENNIPYPNAWRYRDWVIQSINADQPFDDFVRHQIAGDLMPARDTEAQKAQWTATGFLMLGPKNFGEPNRQKLLMDVADEQIDVTSRAILGLTVSCARCHDHKFDPVPTRDYYALSGIFRSTYTINEAINAGPRDPNADAPWSERPLGTPEQVAVVEAYQEKLGKMTAEVNDAREKRRQISTTAPGGIESGRLDGIVLDNSAAEVVGSWKLSNYSTNFVDRDYLHDGNERTGKGKKRVRFRPEIPQDGFYELRLAYTARPNRATNVPVRVEGAAQRTVYLNQTVEPRYDKAFETLGQFELRRGTNNVVEVLTDGTKGFVVVDALQCLPQDIELAARLKKGGAEGPSMMTQAMAVQAADDLEYKLADLRATAPPPAPMAMAVREGESKDVPLQLRGDPDKPGTTVPRGFLTALPKAKPAELKSSGRLELAEWLADPDNPLTARVAANRIWQHLFGQGLVGTPDNFGRMGEVPSHPELLDYLAGELIDQDWSRKKLIRRVMLTQAYQASSAANLAAERIDPENRLLWRMNRKRLEAEALRDSILAINGALNPQVGGQDADTELPVTNPPVQSGAMNSTRRSVYLRIQRNNVPDFLRALDFPDPHALAGQRYVTAAPTQALLFMNSPLVIEQARLWAEKLLAETGRNDRERLALVWEQAYARAGTARELELALGFLARYDTSLAQLEPVAEKRRLKVWAGLCHALIESTEFRFLN